MTSLEKKVLGAAAAVVLGLSPAWADVVWDSGGGSDTAFHTAENWDTDVLPTSDDNVDINNGGTAVFSADSGAMDVKRCFIGDNSSSESGTLEVTGGTLRCTHSTTKYTTRVGRRGTGTVHVSGGYFGVGHLLQVGGDGGTGTLTLTGGEFEVYRRGTSSSELADVSLDLLDGSLTIYGGTFETRAGVELGASGTFSVQGAGAELVGIGTDDDYDGFWLQNAGATLEVGVNLDGVTKIYIEDVDDDGGNYAVFENGSILDVAYFGAGNGSGTWTVVELENGDITNNGLVFAESVDTNIWSFAVDNSGDNGLLTVTAAGDAPVTSSDMNWTGAAGTDWFNPLNWDTYMIPTYGSKLYFDGGTADYTSGVSSNYNALRMYSGTLNISGGEFTATKTAGLDSWVGNDSSATGAVSQTGGEVNINELELGKGGGSVGVYTLSDGTLNIARGLNDFSLYLGGNHDGSSAGEGVFSITGGEFSTRTGVKVGDSSAGGTGTFNVYGAEASIGVGSSGSLDGWWEQGAGSTLYAAPDLRGLTTITISDYEADGGTYAVFEAGALLDVGYYDGGYGGGTWTVMEVENGAITNNGLAFAPGVDTSVWSFDIDNSGDNGILTITAVGDPAPVPVDVTLTVGDTRNQMMRYGIDYERLWFWYGDGLEPVPDWSVVDCNVDYVRTAMNSGYELTEGEYDLKAYTKKIIPMMTAMREANPNIKWFASPRPLDEAVSGASWQPYPLWVTGASDYDTGDYDFNPTNCANYMITYLLLMKSYGFKITYMDLTNEWQSNYASSGGRFGPDDAVVIKSIFDEYLTNPWPHPELDADLLLEADDFPLMIGASSWNYDQGSQWISKFTSDDRRAAIDIASSHNTDKTGTAQDFADAAAAALGDDAEIWETEQHGWKGNSSTSEAMSFSYMIETVRAGFTGLSGWLAIGTTSQGHCYLLNNGSEVTRNVKYYMFKKLSNTSNYGYALDIDETDDLTSAMALIRENLLTVWIINSSDESVYTEIDLANYEWDGSEVTWTRWDEDLSIDGDETPEGIEGTADSADAASVIVELEANAAYCIEIPLVDHEDNFPFVQAENYTAGSGVTIESCSDIHDGEMVAFAAAGSEISFDLDVTKTYTNDVAFRVASAVSNIAFDVYAGTNLLASVDRMATGGEQKWTTVYVTFPVDGGPMELTVEAAGGGWNLNWIEFEPQFYSPDGIAEDPVDPAVAFSALDSGSVSIEWSGVEGATYSLQRSADLGAGFTTVESGIPVQTATNINTMAAPDDTGFYRVILE